MKSEAESNYSISAIGSWLGSFAGASTEAPQYKLDKQSKAADTGAPTESLVSFENMVKDCQVELVEVMQGICCGEENDLSMIEVTGEVKIKALIPGDTPKI